MRRIRWLVIAGSLLLTLSGSSLAQDSQGRTELKVLSLELMGTGAYGETIPRAHFFIEPETGAWGAAGDWAYWEPEGGSYLRRDAEGIYRTWLLTGQERMITSIPQGGRIILSAVSPDGQWVAFATMTEPSNLIVYAVRCDGSEQRLLMHVGYAERVWGLGWSKDGQSVEFEVEPMYYVTARFSARLDGSVITVDGGWYHISSDYQWMTWRRWGYALDSHVIRLDTGEVRDLPASVSITPIWSPDSQWLLYITRENEREEIYRERPDGSVVQRVTPQPAHSYSMWSDPEEKWLYIDEAGQNLYRVRFDQLESELQLVAELSGWFAPYGWAPESVPGGPWLYFEGSSQCCDSGDIYRLNPETREVQPLTDDPAAYSNLFWSPEDMPGGPWLYFLSNRNNVQNSEYTIFRMRPDGSELERVTDQPADYDRLFWSPEDIAGGPWLYFLSNLDNTQGDTYAIFRMRPDGSELKRLTEFNLEPGGWHTTPKTVIQWFANHQWMEYGMVFPISCRMHPDGSARICFDDITTSPDGAWATVTAMTEDSETNNIYGLRQDGTSDLINLTQQSGKANYRLLAWAPEAVPDGPWLYFESDFSGNWELYRVSINNLQLENLTRDPGEDTFMDSANDIWSPEGVVGGPWLYFLSDRAGGLNLYRMQPDGSEVEMLTPTPEEHLYVRWSPDRRWLVFWASDIANVTDGFRMRPDGSELQQTIWLVKPDGAGDWHLREETPLDNDRWILEQDIDLSDCTNWMVKLRAANSSNAQVTINIGTYVDPKAACYVFGTTLEIGSHYLDGSYPPGERVIWLPVIINRD